MSVNIIGAVVLLYGSFLTSQTNCTRLHLGKLSLADGGHLGPMYCESEVDCLTNAYCTNRGYCVCKDDFVEDSFAKICRLKAKRINDTCNIDIQCSSSFGLHAVCHKPHIAEGQCQCRPRTHFQDGICYESVPLDGPCKVSDNCVSKSGVATYCARSVCVCTTDYHPSDDRLDCILDVALGEVCSSDENCMTSSSYCSGVCRCQMGYVVSKDGIKCLLDAKVLKTQCEEDLQCQRNLPNTFCDPQEFSCKCAPFTHELDGGCWISARLGEPCSHPNQCVGPSLNRSTVSCVRGVCGCGAEYERSAAGCVRKQFKGEPSSCSFHHPSLVLVTVLFILSIFE